MNLTLLKADARRNLPLFVIIVYVMLLYFVVIAYMFDPSDSSSLSSMMELLPQGLMSSFGFGEVATNLTDFIVSYYYGFLVFVFPMIYCIITANQLVAKMVDNGSFAYLLMAPVSRCRIIVTKGSFLLLAIAVLFSILYAAGVAICRFLFGNMLNEAVFLQLNVNAALLTMTVGMVCFFYACYFNESRQALSFSAGVNIGFLLLFMLGGVSEKSEFLKQFSIYSLLDTDAILQGSGAVGVCLLLLLATMLLFAASVFVFHRKNLPI